MTPQYTLDLKHVCAYMQAKVKAYENLTDQDVLTGKWVQISANLAAEYFPAPDQAPEI